MYSTYTSKTIKMKWIEENKEIVDNFLDEQKYNWQIHLTFIDEDGSKRKELRFKFHKDPLTYLKTCLFWIYFKFKSFKTPWHYIFLNVIWQSYEFSILFYNRVSINEYLLDASKMQHIWSDFLLDIHAW